jgi:hypothetical protein
LPSRAYKRRLTSAAAGRADTPLIRDEGGGCLGLCLRPRRSTVGTFSNQELHPTEREALVVLLAAVEVRHERGR